MIIALSSLIKKITKMKMSDKMIIVIIRLRKKIEVKPKEMITYLLINKLSMNNINSTKTT